MKISRLHIFRSCKFNWYFTLFKWVHTSSIFHAWRSLAPSTSWFLLQFLLWVRWKDTGGVSKTLEPWTHEFAVGLQTFWRAIVTWLRKGKDAEGILKFCKPKEREMQRYKAISHDLNPTKSSTAIRGLKKF